MKAATKAKLQAAMDFCDENDKSTAFMLEYMQDMAGVDLDCVLRFLEGRSAENNPQKATP